MNKVHVTLEELKLIQEIAQENNLVNDFVFDILQDDQYNLYIRYNGTVYNRACSISIPLYNDQTVSELKNEPTNS